MSTALKIVLACLICLGAGVLIIGAIRWLFG